MSAQIISFDDLNALPQMFDGLIKRVESLTIQNEAQFREAGEIYVALRDIIKLVDDKSKEAKEPFQKAVKSINARSKELLEPIEKIKVILNLKQAAYLKIVEDQKKAEKQRMEEAADMLGVTISHEEEKKVVTNEHVVTYVVREKRFKIIDLSQIPFKYLMANEALIAQDIKLGREEIPGVEIYEEEHVRTRKK